MPIITGHKHRYYRQPKDNSFKTECPSSRHQGNNTEACHYTNGTQYVAHGETVGSQYSHPQTKRNAGKRKAEKKHDMRVSTA